MISRRRTLQLAGTTVGIALAGCTDAGDEEEAGTNGDGENGDEPD